MDISTFQKITQPPQAPSTPVIAQQAIEELIDYYRELAHFHHHSIEYHQKLAQQHQQEAKAAEKQLADIEALLHPLTITGDRQSNGNANGNSIDKTAKTTVITPSENRSQPNKQLAEKLESQESQTTKSQTVIEDSTQNNSHKNSTTEATKTKKLAKRQNTNKTSKSSKSFSSRLPLSEKLTHHETIVDAVAVCLQEYYPRVVSVKNILEYYYPDGLDELAKKKAYASFSDCLSKGAGKQGWVKISKGNYRWKDESKQS